MRKLAHCTFPILLLVLLSTEGTRGTTWEDITTPTTPHPHPHPYDTCRLWKEAEHRACYQMDNTPCAPTSLPPHLVERFTMGGAASTAERMVVDDTMGGKGTHYSTTGEGVKGLVARAEAGQRRTRAGSREALAAAKRKMSGARARDRHAMFRLAVVEASLARPELFTKDQRGVVFGSMSPWAEAELLAAGLGAVTTIEYNELTYDDPRLSVMSVVDLANSLDDDGGENGGGLPFAVAVSLSSFDHDGLGRYGDPLNPEADLQIMDALATCSGLLRPDALAFVSVPVGPDALVFNLMRRYGRARLPHFFRSWSLALDVGDL